MEGNRGSHLESTSVLLHACACTPTHVYVHTPITCMYTHPHFVCTPTHMYIHSPTCACTYPHVNAPTTSVYTHLRVCTPTHMYMPTNTYIHPPTLHTIMMNHLKIKLWDSPRKRENGGGCVDIKDQPRIPEIF